MKNCFKFKVEVNDSDNHEFVPMRGRNLKEASHKVRKLSRVISVISSALISPDEYFRLKESKKDATPVAAAVQSDDRKVVMTAGSRPFASLQATSK